MSEPRFSPEELARLNAENKRTFEINGKQLTGYECKQVMRRIETTVRNTKDQMAILKASGENMPLEVLLDENLCGGFIKKDKNYCVSEFFSGKIIKNAENRGVDKFYSRVHGSENAKGDPFALVMEGVPNLENLYLNAEKDDGYIRDQSVFGDGISIEDTMNVLVRYENGAIMSYSLTAYSPKEGYRVVFTGIKGRIEAEASEVTYVNGSGNKDLEGATKENSLKVYPMFGISYDVEIPTAKGGHGGGDPVLLNDIFGTPEPDPLERAASHVSGAMSILTGIAANKSIATGRPVDIKDLVTF